MTVDAPDPRAVRERNLTKESGHFVHAKNYCCVTLIGRAGVAKMSRIALVALDLGAILVLMLGLYFPRHRRKDMLVAYLG